MGDTAAVTIADMVRDGDGYPRWVVVGLFVGAEGGEPRCVDYRVRTVPRAGSIRDGEHIARRIVRALERAAKDDPGGYLELAALHPPAEGIPRRVFEEASQVRLLARLRDADAEGVRTGLTERGRELLARQSAPKRRGRPPRTDLGTKLRILAAVERAYADGGTLQDVADEHHMSRSAVRDLVSWARNDCEPRLFTGAGPGRRWGGLTPEARAMLEAGS